MVTAACVITLAPVRDRVQRVVDRRLYPVRRAALSALDDLLPRIAREGLGADAPPRTHAAPHNLHLLLPMVVFGVVVGLGISRALGALGAVIAGLGAGALGAFALASVALGAVSRTKSFQNCPASW